VRIAINKNAENREPIKVIRNQILFMKRLLAGVIILLILTSFMPGEPVATLTCKSESGRTKFTAVLPSCAYLESAELSIDGSKLQFSDEDGSYIIFDPTNRVFTVFLESKRGDAKDYRFLKFWADPSSFKKVKSENGTGSQFHDSYEFKAYVYATEPRQVKEPNTKTIELLCTLEYEL
jgi:hypothetical protein